MSEGNIVLTGSVSAGPTGDSRAVFKSTGSSDESLINSLEINSHIGFPDPM